MAYTTPYSRRGDDNNDDDALVAEPLSEYERERGKPIPSLNHAFLQKRVIAALLRYELQYLVLPEISIELAEQRYTPDIAVYFHFPINWKTDVIRLAEPPLLTIEILSPKQALSDVFAKADEYLDNGVEEAWIVIPEIQSITVCKKLEKHKTYTTGEVRHAQTGITLSIEELFALA
jgi:hypothetical protein